MMSIFTKIKMTLSNINDGILKEMAKQYSLAPTELDITSIELLWVGTAAFETFLYNVSGNSPLIGVAAVASTAGAVITEAARQIRDSEKEKELREYDNSMMLSNSIAEKDIEK